MVSLQHTNLVYITCSDVIEVSIKPFRHIGGTLNVNEYWYECGNLNHFQGGYRGWQR